MTNQFRISNIFLWSFVLQNTSTSSFSWNKPSDSTTRRNFILKAPAVGIITIETAFLNPQKAWSRNLPESTGADFSSTGTIEKLVPILKIRSSLLKARDVLSNGQSLDKDILNNITLCLSSIPKDEKKFKQIFDEYSDPVSYKQKYMDSNAFLVYYTKGFDGPGRESIEKGIPKQTLQYGARNDIWTSFDDFLVEIKFADPSSAVRDILMPLDATLKNIDSYLNLAPRDDVAKALSSL